MAKICLINVDRLRKKISEFHIREVDEPSVQEPDKVYEFEIQGKKYEMHFNWITIDWNGNSVDNNLK